MAWIRVRAGVRIRDRVRDRVGVGVRVRVRVRANLLELLECGAEGGDELGRQLLDETHRVREEHLVRVRVRVRV